MELPNTEKIIENISNAKFFPSTIRVLCNDKLTKKLFQAQKKSFRDKILCIDENVSIGKEQKEIKTKFKILGVDSLDEFDHAIFDICVSEQLAGNFYTTVSAIFRALIGQVASNIQPTENQRDAIIKSLQRLITAEIAFLNLDENLKLLGYAKGNKIFGLQATPILPAVLYKETSCRVNGNDTENVLYFHCLSPLYEIANLKSQILRYPHELFNVPNQNNTPRVIALKSYVMRRIAEIKSHKMTPTITFDDVYKKCRISDAAKSIQFNARETILKFFNHLQDKGEIKTFEVIKKHTKFHGVKFTF